MSSIVIELQRESLEPGHRVADILRKALLVARKLGVVEFKKWVTRELNGYGVDDEIPQYRYVVGEVKAHNPYCGWIPIVIGDPEMAALVKRQRITQPIGDLESLVGESEGGFLKLRFSTALELELMKGMDVPFQPVLHIGKNQIASIVDMVRSAIVEWTLRLEEEGLMGEDYTFSAAEKIKAKYSGVVNIQHFQGVFGDVSRSEINQDLSMMIEPGDEIALARHLESIGIPEKDVKDVIKILKDEKRPSAQNVYGPKLARWMGDMVGKAATGVWKVAVSSAGDLLTKALAAYYGIGG